MLDCMKALHWCCVVWILLVSTRVEAQDGVSIAAASSLSAALNGLTLDSPVRLTVGSSSRLAQQIEAGLDADIAILADDRWMDQLEQNGWIAKRNALIRNRLVIVGSPDLHGANRIGIGAQGVPIGNYAREALHSLGMLDALQDQLISAPNASAVLAQAESGLVDSAIVYSSDAHRSQTVSAGLVIAQDAHRPIEYTIGLTQTGQDNQAAVAWFDRLQSEASRAALTQYGFTESTPPITKSNPRITAPPIETREPLMRSLWIALLALLVSLPPAIALGWLMARRSFTGKTVLSTVCLAPLVLPPVVTGWLLLRLAHWTGVDIAFTPWAAVVAAAVVGFPLLMVLIRGAIESVDVRYEQQAQTLGLTPFAAFRRVTLPMALPGLAAGCILAFARALGEFGATAMFAGDQPETTRTLALAVYAATETPGAESSATHLVLSSIVITLVALFAYERLVWNQRRQREDWS